MFRTIDIVPSSIRDDPQVQAACEAIDVELSSIYDCIPSICFWPFVEKQVPPLLDVLFWEMHVDFYQMVVDGSPLTNEKKIELINKSIEWHRHKGTKWVCNEVLNSIWTGAYVTEWYEYGGNPYFFKIIVDQSMDDPELTTRVYNAIMAVKNVRSWLEGFFRPRTSLETIYAGGTVLRYKIQTIPSYPIRSI